MKHLHRSLSPRIRERIRRRAEIEELTAAIRDAHSEGRDASHYVAALAKASAPVDMSASAQHKCFMCPKLVPESDEMHKIAVIGHVDNGDVTHYHGKGDAVELPFCPKCFKKFLAHYEAQTVEHPHRDAILARYEIEKGADPVEPTPSDSDA